MLGGLVNAAERSDLTVLYVGPSPTTAPPMPYYKTGKDRERFAELHTERPEAFRKLLSQHFANFKIIVASEYLIEMSSEFDVTIFDAKPPVVETIKQSDGWEKSIRLPDDFSHPALMIGEVGPFTLGRYGNDFLLDHLCACLDAHAHGLRKDHPIFTSPNNVDLSYDEQPTERSYLARASGRHLGPTMPMWRVQTEGYRDGDGMLIGVVTPSKVLDVSPDGEFISAGKNSKGVDSVALGRQGSFFHWGFAASPNYMTDEAKLVFVNAVHYISQFEGQRAITKKQINTSRADLDDIYYTLSDEGFSKWQDLLDESQKKREEQRKEIEAKQADGQELTEFEQMRLKPRPRRAYTRFDLVSLPETLKSRFGEEWDRYVTYYRENEDYLYCPDAGTGRGFYLDVDPVVKQFGIRNDNIKLLEHAIEMLDNGDKPLRRKALSTLKRYTEEDFSEADAWRAWLDTYRQYLYFSEVSGFKFLINTNALPTSLKSVSTVEENQGSNFAAVVSKVQVPQVSDAEPVVFRAVLRKVNTPNGPTVRLIVKSKIRQGWHIYAHVPETAPYVQTKLDVSEVSNLRASGNWERSASEPSLEDAAVLIWEDEAVIWRDYSEIEKEETSSLRLKVSYQACDANRCFAPKTITLKPVLGQ